MLIKMEIRYGSKESIELCDMIARKMACQAIESSSFLAEKYGTYPKYDMKSVSQSAYWSKHTNELNRDRIFYNGLRNSQLLTIAPTGTLSSMLGVSGGIEPIFANYYERKTESLHGHDEYYKVYTPIVKKYIEDHGLKDDSELPDHFITAQELNYRERIDMQAIWQKHIDASISSTVNLPNNTKVEDVEKLYLYAWEKGLKGVTIFRDGCERTGILSANTKKDSTEETYSINELPRGIVIKADDNCVGRKRTLHTGCGTLHCEAFFDPDNGDLLETYFSKGSTGGCNQFMIGLSRMISLAARGGIDINSIVDQLRSSGTCPSYAVRTATKHDTSKGSSCPVAIGNALIDMYEEIMNDIYDDAIIAGKTNVQTTKTSNEETNIADNLLKCPQCGGNLIFEGGCNTCKECGWSKCD